MSPTTIRSRVVAALVPVVIVVCLAAPAAAQPPNQVQPFVSCIEFMPMEYVRAYFGYVSTYPTEVTQPIGFDNFTTPGVINRGQPTTFAPGFHDRAFSTIWQVSGSMSQVSWVLQRTFTASARRDPGLLCGVRSSGDWDATATYIEGDLVRYPIENIPFTLSDVDNIWNLTVLAASSDPTLLPLSGIFFDGFAANRTVSVIPAPNRSGTAVVTLYVTDGVSVATESFVVIVVPPSAGVDPGDEN
jgi:hypothetical protein